MHICLTGERAHDWGASGGSGREVRGHTPPPWLSLSLFSCSTARSVARGRLAGSAKAACQSALSRSKPAWQGWRKSYGLAIVK